MVRITRRDFLKYCSIAAGALGLSASTMMKVEKVLANTAAPTVVWISGAACTGCTMSLLNSVFYTTVDDVLLNRINLAYLDTAMATAGAYVNGFPYGGANSITESHKVFTEGKPFVLVVEGAIPTARPAGSLIDGDYCRIGDLTGDGSNTETVLGNVKKFAALDNCLAVLSVGTCSSFGGIPGAQGNVTGAKGVAFSGTAMGGAIVSNGSAVNSIIVKNSGSGYSYADSLTVAITGGYPSTNATASATIGMKITVTAAGSGYDTANLPIVTISGGGGTGATASATIRNGGIASVEVTNQGTGYNGSAITVAITKSSGDLTGAATAVATTGVTRVNVGIGGADYKSIPDVTISGGTGTGATAYVASLLKGAVKTRTGLAAKVINISGCPPHPDWIVGTIAHILDTHLTLPAVNTNYQPVDYGYKEYQCNAGPCPWRYNNAAAKDGYNPRYPEGDSKDLGKYKWTRDDLGCLGILGCKGRKTKADCSRRRWNSDEALTYGVNWCVGSRAGCHGCTEPAFPDKVGKFFTFV